ncbi:DUF6059 family protein [Actinomadura chokoriensis]|uniref:DUF6059 family protein n=1 Tax=Actinomadura chokoriensis TaxID=454156 RepID=UPI0031F9145F
MGRGLLRRALRYLGAGMGYVGFGVIGMTPSQYMRYMSERADEAEAEECPSALASPPPGHPERLVPGEPLSEEASRLWAQLDDLGR